MQQQTKILKQMSFFMLRIYEFAFLKSQDIQRNSSFVLYSEVSLRQKAKFIYYIAASLLQYNIVGYLFNRFLCFGLKATSEEA